MSEAVAVHFGLWCDPSLGEEFHEVLDQARSLLERDYIGIQGNFPPFQPRAGYGFQIYVHSQFELPVGSQTVGVATRDQTAADVFHCACPEGIAPEDFKEDLCASVVALLVQYCGASTLNWNADTCMGQGLCLAVAGEFYREAIGVFDPAERAWRDTFPLADYVNEPAADGNDPAANGCLFLFFSWLRNKGYGWHQFVLAGLPAESTPRTIYRFLTGDENDPFPAFAQVVADAYQSMAAIATPPVSSAQPDKFDFPEEVVPDRELYESPGWDLTPANPEPAHEVTAPPFHAQQLFEHAVQMPAPPVQHVGPIKSVPMSAVSMPPENSSIPAAAVTSFMNGNSAAASVPAHPWTPTNYSGYPAVETAYANQCARPIEPSYPMVGQDCAMPCAVPPDCCAALYAPYPPLPPNPPLPPYPPYPPA